MNRGDLVRLVAGVAAILALACDSSTGVDPESRAATLTIDPAAHTIPVQGAVELHATLRNASGSPMTGTLTWGTDHRSLVSLEPAGGTVTVRGLSPGTARVWVGGGGLLAEARVVVTGAAARVEVTPATAAMPLGTSMVFRASVTDANGNPLPGAVVAWSGSTPTVVSVNAVSGQVTAAGVGTAQVTASIEGRSGSAQVEVTPTPVATVVVAPDPAEATLGRTLQFYPTLRDQAGTVLTGRAITWSSSNPAVLQVDASGLGQARALGSAVVTATSEGKSGSAQATVVPLSSMVVTVYPASPLVDVGASVRFDADVRNSTGAVVSGLPVTWSISDPSVATMTAAGVATALAPGVTTVTAVVEGRSGTTQLAVRAPLPTLAGVSPDSATAGRVSDLTLTVTGTGFLPTTRVRWNGTDRPTTYQSATRMQATIPAADLEEPDTAAVTVRTPAPGGGTSAAQPFRIFGTRSGVLGDTVSDQLRPAGDVDEFTFQGRAGEDVVLRFQALGGSTQWMEMSLLDASRDRMGYTWSQGTDHTLEQRAEGPYRLERDGMYTVRVRGEQGTEEGPYRFHVMPVRRAPERIDAGVAVNETVSGEDIAPVGDGDDFRFTGTKGDIVTIFFQATSGAADDDLRLTLYSPTGTYLDDVASEGSDATLDGQVMSRVVLPLNGAYTVRVRGVNVREDGGPYRFRVNRIDTRPETASPVVPLGPVVEGESISPRGDLDRFTFSGTAGEEVNIFLQGTSREGADIFWLQAWEPDGDRIASVTSRGNAGTLEEQGEGPILLTHTGTYTLEVRGDNYETEGAYRFRVMPIHLPPESIPAGVAQGEVVSGEKVDVVGDVDEFTFQGTRGTAVNLQFQAMSGLWRDALRAALIDPAGNLLHVVQSDGGDGSLENQQSGRIVLERTGAYVVRVRGATLGSLGPYRFRVLALP